MPHQPWHFDVIEIPQMFNKSQKKLLWYIDPGVNGKTKLAKWLVMNHPDKWSSHDVELCDMRKFELAVKNEIKHDNTITIFDIKRSYCSGGVPEKYYERILEIQRGLIIEEEGITLMDVPIVVVVCPFAPDPRKIPLDRWIIKEVLNDGSFTELYPFSARVLELFNGKFLDHMYL